MSREGPIIRSAFGSSVFHGVLLTAAFFAYDPMELTTAHYEEGVRMVLATVRTETPPTVKAQEEPPPKVVPPPKPRIKRKRPVKPPKPVDQTSKPDEVTTPSKAPPKKTQAAKKAGLQKIGARSKDVETESAAASVADRSAKDAAPSSVTGAAEAAPAGKKTSPKRLIRTYYGTLSSYLRRNYQYPRRARLAAIEGTVLVEILVDREGKVLRVRVARSSGHQILDNAALDSIAKIRHVPAPPDGLQWTKRAIRVPFRYSLKT